MHGNGMPDAELGTDAGWETGRWETGCWETGCWEHEVVPV